MSHKPNSRSLRLPLLATTLLLVIAAAAWQWRDHIDLRNLWSSEVTSQTEVSARKQAESPAAVVAKANSAPTASATVARSVDPLSFGPLPPLDSPLADIVDLLKRRAVEGDAMAACRLAAELRLCDAIRDGLARNQEMLQATQSKAWKKETKPEQVRWRKQLIDETLKRSERYLAESEHCAGMPRADSRLIQQLNHQAATAGHADSISRYLQNAGIAHGNLLDNLPALAAYRSDAEGLARRVAAAGDLMSIIELANAYARSDESTYRSWLAQVVEPHHARALALFLHLRHSLESAPQEQAEPMREDIERRLAELRSRLTPAQASLADAMAARMANRWRPVVWQKASSHKVKPDRMEFDRDRLNCADTSFVPQLVEIDFDH